MPKFEWEQIDDRTQRAKVFGGWIVKHQEDVFVSLHEDQRLQSGYEWRVSICFVPDPTHKGWI